MSAEFYDEEGTKNKSQMLADMHPDVARVVWKWNRWHHHVDYSPYKNNKLIPLKGLGKIWRPNCNNKFICPSYNNGCQCEGILFKLMPC